MAYPTEPREYETFHELDPSQIVHLRHVGEDETAEPEYVDAAYQGGAGGNPVTGKFFVPAEGRTITVSEAQSVARSRHTGRHGWRK